MTDDLMNQATELHQHQRDGASQADRLLAALDPEYVAVDERSVSVALTREGDVDVVVETGPVFGNTIRDGSGLLDVNDFPNSRDFNAISSEINRRVEEHVIPILKEKAAPGASIHFAGCVDVANPETDLKPLRLVPVMIRIP